MNHRAAYHKKYYKKNKKRIDERNKNYCLQNKEARESWMRHYIEENRETIRTNWRRRYQERKEKELRVYYTKLKYERKNPGRGKKYYYENRDAILVQKKIYRESKRLGKSQYTESPQTEKLRHILGKG